MDPYLTIESAGGSLASNEIASSGVGVEVEAGLTGLGLPPVDLQFDQSAGEGARYRGRRVQQRTLDFTFNLYAPDRSALKAEIDRLSRILNHPCTITFHDPDADEAWRIVAYRSGGGDYAYGRDADGDDEAQLQVTFTTAKPYWEALTAEQRTISASGSHALALDNQGTVGAPPVWTITGPSLGFTATSPSGERLRVYGLIDNGTTLTIDCAEGTVKDNHGFNRYNFIADMPRFWQVPPGDSVATVTVDSLSNSYQTAFTTPRKNFVKNPNFADGAASWTMVGFEWVDQYNQLHQTDQKTTERPYIETVCSGLTVGNNYAVGFAGIITGALYGANTKVRKSRIEVRDGSVTKGKNFPDDVWTLGRDALFEFTAENTSVTLRFYPEAALGTQGNYWRSDGWIDNVYLGDPGPYFDGDTPDTSTMIYSWSSTTRNSTSLATPVSQPGGQYGTPQVTMAYRPRKDILI